MLSWLLGFIILVLILKGIDFIKQKRKKGKKK